jgi:hypothetical protein
MKLKHLAVGPPLAALVLSSVLELCANAESLTNAVPITENLYFQLRGGGGPPTNWFSASQLIHYEVGSREAGSFKTNKSCYRALPPDQSFAFRLFDQTGAEVQKTRLGREYSRVPVEPRSMAQAAGLHARFLDQAHRLIYPLFTVNQMFDLTNSGNYELEVRIRIWAQTTNKGPPNEIIGFSNPNIGTNYQFGLITSPPIRARVVK